jgi:hypothetical protein
MEYINTAKLRQDGEVVTRWGPLYVDEEMCPKGLLEKVAVLAAKLLFIICIFQV